MQNHSTVYDNCRDVIVIRTAVIVEEVKSHAYPYTIYSTEEVLYMLGDVYSAGVYALHSQTMTRAAP